MDEREQRQKEAFRMLIKDAGGMQTTEHTVYLHSWVALNLALLMEFFLLINLKDV